MDTTNVLTQVIANAITKAVETDVAHALDIYAALSLDERISVVMLLDDEVLDVMTDAMVKAIEPEETEEDEHLCVDCLVEKEGVAIPWDYLNPKYKYVFKDRKDVWYASVDEPRILVSNNQALDTFVAGEYVNINDVVPENGSIHWSKSIVSRPE